MAYSAETPYYFNIVIYPEAQKSVLILALRSRKMSVCSEVETSSFEFHRFSPADRERKERRVKLSAWGNSRFMHNVVIDAFTKIDVLKM